MNKMLTDKKLFVLLFPGTLSLKMIIVGKTNIFFQIPIEIQPLFTSTQQFLFVSQTARKLFLTCGLFFFSLWLVKKHRQRNPSEWKKKPPDYVKRNAKKSSSCCLLPPKRELKHDLSPFTKAFLCPFFLTMNPHKESKHMVREKSIYVMFIKNGVSINITLI